MNSRIDWFGKQWDVELIQYQKSKHMGLCIVEVTDEDTVLDYLISTHIKTLEHDEIAIWNFDSFQNILDELIKAEIVEQPHKYIEKNFGDLRYKVPVVRLKISFMNLVGIKESQSKQNSGEYANSARPAAK